MIAEIQVNERRYTVVDDQVSRFEVVLRGRIVEELDAASVTAPFWLRADREDLFCKTVTGGVFCVAAEVPVAFANLASINYPVKLAIRSDGYREKALTVIIPQNATFPIAMADVVLRRIPVRVQGRVNQESGAHAPVANARVVTIAPSDRALLLRSPVQANHSTAASVRGRPFTPVALPLPPRILEKPVQAGQRTIVINDRQGLAAGQLLRFGPESLGYFREIQTVAAGPGFGDVLLTAPSERSFTAATSLEAFAVGVVAPGAVTLSRSADQGDGLLSLSGPLTGATVDIVEAGLPAEYHAVGALTDADGYYALNGITGFKKLDLRVTAPALPTKNFVRILAYGQPTNTWDFRL